MVLQGAVVTTERTDATGFSYSFAHLGGALEHLFEKKNGPVIQASKQKSGNFSIRDSTRVQAPFEAPPSSFFQSPIHSFPTRLEDGVLVRTRIGNARRS